MFNAPEQQESQVAKIISVNEAAIFQHIISFNGLDLSDHILRNNIKKLFYVLVENLL